MSYTYLLPNIINIISSTFFCKILFQISEDPTLITEEAIYEVLDTNHKINFKFYIFIKCLNIVLTCYI